KRIWQLEVLIESGADEIALGANLDVKEIVPGHCQIAVEPATHKIENLLIRSVIRLGLPGRISRLATLFQALNGLLYADFTVPLQRGKHDSHALAVPAGAHFTLGRNPHRIT